MDKEPDIKKNGTEVIVPHKDAEQGQEDDFELEKTEKFVSRLKLQNDVLRKLIDPTHNVPKESINDNH